MLGKPGARVYLAEVREPARSRTTRDMHLAALTLRGGDYSVHIERRCPLVMVGFQGAGYVRI